jgi:2Fe-2S ferredoxin
MNTIEFIFEEKGKENITITNAEQGDSILEVALKNNIEIHHNCGGVCACSTCHIYLENGANNVEELSDKEEDFIDRARNPKLTSRLSCQCTLLNDNATLKVIVCDQSLIHGE